jgi:hypothetical protein
MTSQRLIEYLAAHGHPNLTLYRPDVTRLDMLRMRCMQENTRRGKYLVALYALTNTRAPERAVICIPNKRYTKGRRFVVSADHLTHSVISFDDFPEYEYIAYWVSKSPAHFSAALFALYILEHTVLI